MSFITNSYEKDMKCMYTFISIHANHGVPAVRRDLKILSPIPTAQACTQQQIAQVGIQMNLGFISVEGDSTASLGNLFQCSVMYPFHLFRDKYFWNDKQTLLP